MCPFLLCRTKVLNDDVSEDLNNASLVQMLLDPMGGIVMTNDGNAILREVFRTLRFWLLELCFTNSAVQLSLYCRFLQIQVQHPAAKSMIEISRTQDEEVGDGTTSVIILGECASVVTFVSYVNMVSDSLSG